MESLNDKRIGRGFEKFRNKVMRREVNSLRVVMLGSRNVGKTALIIRCLTHRFYNHYVPAKEESYRYTVEMGTKKVTFDVMDSNGKNNATICYADAIVLVYSVTDKSSYEHVKTLIKQVRYLNINNIPLVVIANKIDQTKSRTVTVADGQSLSREHSVQIFERSAAIPSQDLKSVFLEVYKLVQSAKLNSSIDSSFTLRKKLSKTKKSKSLEALNISRMRKSYLF